MFMEFLAAPRTGTQEARTARLLEGSPFGARGVKHGDGGLRGGGEEVVVVWDGGDGRWWGWEVVRGGWPG